MPTVSVITLTALASVDAVATAKLLTVLVL
jgi:hypothetical protein